MKYSSEISKNFSKNASKYDNDAHIQKLSSNKLIELLKEKSSKLIDGKCLEIGCGTGFVTEHILKLHPNRGWEITDLSQEMLNLCQRNMHTLVLNLETVVQGDKVTQDLSPSTAVSRLNNATTSFKCVNGEQIEASNEYALIVSGMTFQWFKDFAQALNRLKNAVQPGGILCFSCLNQDSFTEWRSMCKQTNVPCSMIPLPSVSLISNLFADPSWSFDIESESHKIAYTSAQAFFKHLKNIGANATPQKHLTVPEMRRLIHHWDEQTPLGLTVTYSITYVVAKKTER